MSILVTVDEDADGPVVIKRATTPADAERLVAETHLLGIAAHPGVVAVVASDDGRLVLAHAGDRTLAHHVPRDLDEVIALVGGLAGTLDDLHRSGIAHMRVTPEHVVIAPHGRPVLCGLSAAVIDPDDAACGVDVEAVARLGLLLLDRCRRAQATVTDRLTWSISARRRRLQALLTDAGDPTRTPQSRMGPLSEAIAGFGLPEPPLPPAPPRPRPDDASPWPLRQVSAPPHDAPPRRGDPRRIAIAVAATLAMVGLAATLTWPRDARTAPSLVALPTPPTATEVPVAAEVPTSGDEQVADEPAPPTPTPTPTPAPISGPANEPCGAPPPPAADLDEDGCPEQLRLEDRVVTGGGEVLVVGAPGDQIVLGDWDCDGEATVALFRPSNGAVFVFARWPTAGGSSLATPSVAQLRSAERIEARRNGACDELWAVGSDGDGWAVTAS